MCKPDFYGLAVFAGSPDIEGSIFECDTNLFRNVTNCNAIVLIIKTCDDKVFVFFC